MDRWGDFWRFTEASVRRLLQQEFPKDADYPVIIDARAQKPLAIK
jgi:hypothetical protein